MSCAALGVQAPLPCMGACMRACAHVCVGAGVHALATGEIALFEDNDETPSSKFSFKSSGSSNKTHRTESDTDRFVVVCILVRVRLICA